MGTSEIMLGVFCSGLESHPGGSRNTPGHFMLLKLWPGGPLGSYADFPYV